MLPLLSIFRSRRLPADVAALQTLVNDLTAQLEAEKRRSVVKDAEIETLAAVIVRDRERVKAETATAIRQSAEAQGLERLLPRDGRTH